MDPHWFGSPGFGSWSRCTEPTDQIVTLILIWIGIKICIMPIRIQAQIRS